MWYLDFGASNHMTSSVTKLQHVVPYNGNLTVQTANGDHLPITFVGDTPSPLPLTNVLVSPHLSTNLVSIGQLVEDNYNVSYFFFWLCVPGPRVEGSERERA